MAPPKKAEKAAGGKNKPSATKLVEDKTFGMKNKKGGAAQKQIAQLTTQMKAGGNAEQKRKEAEKLAREREKKAAEDAKREADLLLNKPAQIQKVPFGVDPKTVVCIFYKKGNCEKGKKCKFSHDLEMERRTEKRSLYTDTRKEEEEDKKKTETSADWDEAKLQAVVTSKKGNQQTTTDKVCKYFIEAIEDGKYGWFWICPNGGDKCKYKHALPPGLVHSGSHNAWLIWELTVKQIRTEDERAEGGREGADGQVTAKESDARGLPGVGAAQADGHSHACHARILCEVEEGAARQEGRRRAATGGPWTRMTRLMTMEMITTMCGIWKSYGARRRRCG
jgi:hypothetical protein